jgi:RimJ/RimL family protein N-acetyltransferase
MVANPITAAPIVTDTNPAQALGPEPLIGKHVKLERLTKDHIPDLWESIGSHPDIWTWWLEGPFTEPEFHENMVGFSTFMADDLAVYAVILLSGPHKGKAGGLALGMSEDRTANRIGELGAFYGPWLQRSTAGTEAAFLVADRIFELNHRRMGWKTNSLNLESRKAAERYGFVLEGIHRQDQINKGRSRDTAFYGIIDSEWPVCKKAFEMWLEDGNFDEEGKQKRRLEEIRESLKSA